MHFREVTGSYVGKRAVPARLRGIEAAKLGDDAGARIGIHQYPLARHLHAALNRIDLRDLADHRGVNDQAHGLSGAIVTRANPLPKLQDRGARGAIGLL